MVSSWTQKNSSRWTSKTYLLYVHMWQDSYLAKSRSASLDMVMLVRFCCRTKMFLHIFLIPDSLILLKYWAPLIRIQEIRWPSPSEREDQNQNQYSFTVPQTGNFVCYSSWRTEYYKKDNNDSKNKQYIYKGKKQNRLVYIHINMILHKVNM